MLFEFHSPGFLYEVFNLHLHYLDCHSVQWQREMGFNQYLFIHPQNKSGCVFQLSNLSPLPVTAGNLWWSSYFNYSSPHLAHLGYFSSSFLLLCWCLSQLVLVSSLPLNQTPSNVAQNGTRSQAAQQTFFSSRSSDLSSNSLIGFGSNRSETLTVSHISAGD